MQTKPNVPVNRFFKGSYNPEYENVIRRTQKLCRKYNRLNPTDTKAQQKTIAKLLGRSDKDTVITPPFWCDYGYNIFVGKHFYSNHNLVITDGARVEFGDNVFIAPNCCFTTAEHAIDPVQRREGFEVAMPIKVGNDVWIGAGCVILAGVTIGDGSVIGAGSVVTNDIPAGVVAVGVPCRVKREITEADKSRYPMYSDD